MRLAVDDVDGHLGDDAESSEAAERVMEVLRIFLARAFEDLAGHRDELDRAHAVPEAAGLRAVEADASHACRAADADSLAGIVRKERKAVVGESDCLQHRAPTIARASGDRHALTIERCSRDPGEIELHSRGERLRVA